MKKGNKSKKKTTAPKKKKPSKKKTFLKNKRLLAVSISIFLFLVIALSLVSVGNRNITGYETDPEEPKGDLFEGIKDVAIRVGDFLELAFRALFGGGEDLYKDKSGMLFTQILFLIIVFGIILLSLRKVDFFKSNPVILNIIALAVSILAVRGISSTELISTILLPSKALGVALLAGIPFVIYFIVINVGFKTQSSILRRVAWIFFAIVFIGLWASSGEEVKASNLQYIYLATAIGAIVMAWIDGTIKKFFLKVEADKVTDINKTQARTFYKTQIGEALENKYMTETERDELVAHYKKQLARLK